MTNDPTSAAIRKQINAMPDTLNLRKTGHKHRADEIVYTDKAAPHNKSGLSVTICLGCGEIITKVRLKM